MKRIFEHIGGVPPRLCFDNMTTAVAQVLKDGERVLTAGFTRFMLHYRFQADLCNSALSNEKGNVESKVGYSRRNAFVSVPVITSVVQKGCRPAPLQVQGFHPGTLVITAIC